MRRCASTSWVSAAAASLSVASRATVATSGPLLERTAAMVMAFVLATLVVTGLVEFWMVLAVALGRGANVAP